jgi:thioesterase domain-containing protein
MPDRPFYALQPPDFGEFDAPSSTLEDIAARYVEEVLSVQSEGPYLLGGWSFGGLVAFEMAQQLQRARQPVGLLAVLDTGIGGAGGEYETVDTASVLVGLATANHLNLSLEYLRQLEPDEQLSFVLEQAKKANNSAAEIDPAQLRRVVRISKASLEARFNYKPRIYPDSLTLIRTNDLPKDRFGKMPSEEQYGLAMGWDSVCSRPPEVHMIPGTHFTIFSEPNVQILANRLNECLERAEARF